MTATLAVRSLRRPPRRHLVLLLLAGLALGGGGPLTACGRRNATTRGDEVPTRIRVQNQRFLDVNIFVVRGGQRMRLGTVSGNTTQVLRIPAYVMNGSLGTLRFIADPIGARSAPVSEEILVSPGDEVVMLIPPN